MSEKLPEWATKKAHELRVDIQLPRGFDGLDRDFVNGVAAALVEAERQGVRTGDALRSAIRDALDSADYNETRGYDAEVNGDDGIDWRNMAEAARERARKLESELRALSGGEGGGERG